MSRKKLLAWALLAALAPLPAQAAVVEHSGALVNLQTAQTGNADSTNTLDRSGRRGACLLEMVSTIGATPTVTVNIVGSMDGAGFYNVAYSTTAAPETVAVAAITITTATTTRVIMRPGHPWRFLKLVMSANTNVTLTSNIYCQQT